MSNVDTVRRLYDAFSARDGESIRTIFDPEIEWIQMDGFPMGGRHVGPDAVLGNVFAKFREHWADWKAVVEEYLDAGETVVALGYYSGIHKDSGKTMRAAFAHVYTLKSNRIVKFVQYTDALRVAEAMT